MFNYMSVQEAAKAWGISERRVQVLCTENRIDGAVRVSRVWLIPQDTKKPLDRRSVPVCHRFVFHPSLSRL